MGARGSVRFTHHASDKYAHTHSRLGAAVSTASPCMHGGPCTCAPVAMCKAKAALQKQKDELKAAQKVKDDGKALLNQVNVPLAKFENDVQVLRSTIPACPLLPELDAMFEQGKRFKKEASEAMGGGTAIQSTKIDAAMWLAKLRQHSKAMHALCKPVKA